MARWKPFPIIGGAYSDDCKPWSSQDTVNYIPVMAEKSGTRSREMLRCLPGFATFCDLGTNAPIRGARNVEGRLFVVSGQTLFSVSPKGASTALGTIPGVQRCSLSHNQVAGGNQVAISNGQAGYVYDTAKSTLVQITDEGFPGAICFDSVDGYITGIDPSRHFAFISDLADATSYNTLDEFQAEGSPDLLRGQAVTHRELWLMGERTIEPFVDTGDATGTFQRAQGTVIEVGLAATHAVAVMDNSVFWLGNDGIVYRANGYTPTRISTHAIEQAIARCNMAQAFAFTYEDRGHKVFYLTFPDGQTWGFDAASGEWHRRQSYGLDRWRINTLTFWNGQWIAGDFNNGKLYALDWDVQHEDGAIFERRRITGAFHDSQNNVIVNAMELVADTGLPGLTAISISGNLPNGTSGDTVSFRYLVNGGIPPLGAVTLASGSLPAGLSLSAAGLVAGTLGAAGTYSWVVAVTDEQGNRATIPDSATVADTINSAIAADAPILHWPLSETSGTVATDLSGNGYHGTISGGYTQSVTGLTLNAKSAGVTYPGSASGSPLDVGTGIAWAMEAVVTRAGSGGSSAEIIAAQWLNANFGRYTNGLSLQLLGSLPTSPVGGLVDGVHNLVVNGPNNVATGARTHLMVVRAGANLTLYANGIAVQSRNDMSALVAYASTGEPFAVGGAGTAYPESYGFIGKVEHVAVYNTAPSAARVLYHAQLLGLA